MGMRTDEEAETKHQNLITSLQSEIDGYKAAIDSNAAKVAENRMVIPVLLVSVPVVWVKRSEQALNAAQPEYPNRIIAEMRWRSYLGAMVNFAYGKRERTYVCKYRRPSRVAAINAFDLVLACAQSDVCNMSSI